MCFNLKKSKDLFDSVIFFGSLDKGIAKTVLFLNSHGFQTTGSCEGGPGHLFPLPTIQIRPDGDIDKARKRLCQFLISQGVKGFSIKTVSMHQGSDLPESYSYIEVEFWSQGALRYLMV